jgi:hypothetical protein
MIIVGDGLYSKQPFIDAVKQSRMSYILVVKPDDHKAANLGEQAKLRSVVDTIWIFEVSGPIVGIILHSDGFGNQNQSASCKGFSARQNTGAQTDILE